MGWSYLNGLTWAQVSRDERFFCQRLYSLADADPQRFVRTLNLLSAGLDLDELADWEVGYEVCFFRDIRHLRGRDWNLGHRYSPKRTFDLCLFSEKEVLIIEAKAQQSFEGDISQLEAFRDECGQVHEILGPSVNRVRLLMIASGSYLTEPVRSELRRRCDTHPVAWAGLADAYRADEVLASAEGAYTASQWGLNNEAYRSGEELMSLWEAGESDLVIGRKGGATSPLLRDDIASGAWKSRSYETRRGREAPNANWLPLAEFVRLVRGG